MPALELRDLSVRLRKHTLLDRINLRVDRGEFVALVGPNGAGKTTLLKTTLALRLPSSGSALLDGKAVSKLNARARAAAVAWLPQHVRAEEPLSVLETVASARFRFPETRAASLAAATAALSRVGASRYAERRVTELSGGERQRIAFACLLAQDANLLLFDEPANHLDPAQQLEIYRLLGELWREGRTIVCINHDVNLLNHLGCPERVRVLALSQGRIVFDTPFLAPDLPQRLGALFAVQMQAVESAGLRFIVPLTGQS